MTGIEDRLWNWGAVMRVGRHKGHCFSAEHWYVRERAAIDDWEERRVPKMMPLQVLDADVVEAAWRSIPEKKQKQVLKLTYVNQAPPRFICLRIGIRDDRNNESYKNFLAQAESVISGILMPKRAAA